MLTKLATSSMRFKEPLAHIAKIIFPYKSHRVMSLAAKLTNDACIINQLYLPSSSSSGAASAAAPQAHTASSDFCR